MKKQFLSIITAGLMLSTTPQITASPELFLGTLAAVAGAIHVRGTQEQRNKAQTEDQERLTKMFNNNALPKELEIIECQTGNDVELNKTPYVVLTTVKKDTGWAWQVFYGTYEQPLSSFWQSEKGTQDANPTIEEPVVPARYGERFDHYINRFNEARKALITRAQEIAAGLHNSDANIQ